MNDMMPITILYYIVSLTNFLKYNIIKKKKKKIKKY